MKPTRTHKNRLYNLGARLESDTNGLAFSLYGFFFRIKPAGSRLTVFIQGKEQQEFHDSYDSAIGYCFLAADRLEKEMMVKISRSVTK
jgi:hypothetical protein